MNQIVILPQVAVEEATTLLKIAHRLTLIHSVEVVAKKLGSSNGLYRPARRITINTSGCSQAFTFIHELGMNLPYYTVLIIPH